MSDSNEQARALKEAASKLDQDRLEKLRDIRTIDELVKRIHALPAVREWIPLESTPLLPEFTGGEGTQDLLHMLLTTGNRSGAYLPPPWAYLAWEWPETRLATLVDLRFNMSSVRNLQLTEMSWLANPEYCKALDQFASGEGDKPELPPELAALYGAIFDHLDLHPQGRTDSAKPAMAKQTERAAPTERDGEVAAAPSEAPKQPTSAEVAAAVPAVSSQFVAAMMDRTRKLLVAVDQSTLAEQWRQIRRLMDSPSFTVSVVGEFSRGKTTLVNGLLGGDLLPVGDLPTTAMLVRIFGARETSLHRILPDQARHRLEMTEATWDDLSAQDEDEDPEGHLELMIDSEWLRSSSVQLVDTPGAGDLYGKRALLATEAIAVSDATLFVVSATMALSLTERGFFDEHVVGKRVPRAAVVLTRLDQVPEREREKLVKHVRRKLDEWAPDLPLWTLHGEDVVPANDDLPVRGAAGIRDALLEWSSSASTAQLRRQQVLGQLGALLSSLNAVLKTQHAALSLSREKRTIAARLAEHEVEQTSIRWQDLAIEMERRCIATGERVDSALAEIKQSIIEALKHILRRTPNPFDWWTEELPYALRVRLLDANKRIEASVRQQVERDTQWLLEAAHQRLSWRLALGGPRTTETSGDPEIVVRDMKLDDIHGGRTKARAIIGVATLAGFVALPPVGIAVGLVGGIANEIILKKKLEEQRKELLPLIDEAVTRVVDSVSEQAHTRLRKTYERITRDIKKQQRAWRVAQLEAIRASLKGEDDTEQKDALSAASKELQQLRQTLGPFGGLSSATTTSEGGE